MKVLSVFLIGLGVFFGIIAAIYWFTSYEDAGFLMLIGSTGLGLLPGGYYLWWTYHTKVRPDDDPQGPSRRAPVPSTPSPARASGPSFWEWVPCWLSSPSSSDCGWPPWPACSFCR